MSDPTLSLSVAPVVASLPPGKHTVFTSIELTAHGEPVDGARPPLSVSFALDVSGSMQGPPLAHVAASVVRLVDLLHAADRTGIVVFSGGAAEVVAPHPLDEATRRTVRTRMARLTAGSKTNVEAGLALARQQLGASPEPTRRHAILLLSDGQPNVGAASVEELRAQVAAMRPAVSVSTLGFGEHHDEAILAAIADAGGGLYRYIPDPTSCQAELAQVLCAQGDVVAEAIELVLVPAEGVEILRVLGAATRVTSEGMVVVVPDLVDEATFGLAVELRAKLTAERISGELLTVRLRWRRAGTPDPLTSTATAEVDVAAGAPKVQPEAHARVLVVRADEARQEARRLADRRQFPGAAAVLRAIVAEIEAAPGFVPADGSPLSEAREALADEIQLFTRAPSPEDYRSFKKHTEYTHLASHGRSMSAMLRSGSRALEFFERTAGPLRSAWLIVRTGDQAGQRFKLELRNTLGRTRTADISISDDKVSRHQADILLVDGGFWIRAAAATNPTRVNGTTLTPRALRLTSGDRVEVGDTVLEYREE